jgi:hypothetical protein
MESWYNMSVKGRLLLMTTWKIVGPKVKRWRLEIGEWSQKVKKSE